MTDHSDTQGEEPTEDLTPDPMRAMAEAFSGSSRAATGTYESQLTPDQVETLDLFVTWLRNEDPKGRKTEATSNSYKSYVAQALAHFKDGGKREDLSTDVKSGVNAFARFLAATQEAA